MMTTSTAPAAILPAPPVVGEIATCLPTAMSQLPPDAIETARAGSGRPRMLTALCLWVGRHGPRVEGSLALLVQYLLEYAYTGPDPVMVFVTLGRVLAFNRPAWRTSSQVHRDWC